MQVKLSYGAFTRSAQYQRIPGLLAATRLSPKQVFIMAVLALNQAFGGLEPEGKYKTEHLFEASVWDAICKAIRRCLGMCLSYLTDNALVPLQYANKPGANNKLYMLIPGVDPGGYSFCVC